MKNHLLIILCGLTISSFAQNVGIGTTTPAERLQVIQTAEADKNVIYGYANQVSSGVDYQNTGVAGFGQGNGVPVGWGYGFGIKGIGSTNGYGAVGVYAALGTSIPSITLNNTYYALYADVRTPAVNRYAGVFLNGNVGIGTVSPNYILDVADRILIRNGPSGSAGVWFNKTDNSSPAGFMGDFDDNYIGFYGNNGASWSLLMNTANGNVGIGNSIPANKLDVTGNLNFTGFLKLNGSAGLAGQVVQSNGAGTPPSWVSPTKFIYDNSSIQTQSATATTSSGTPIDIPNLTNTFITSGSTKAQISFSVNVEGVFCGACGFSKAGIIVVVDGSQNCTYTNSTILNGTGNITLISGTFLNQLSPGTHTIKLQLIWMSGPNVAAFAPEHSNYLSIVLFPQ